tara:strand:- start:83 stop:271 length:189 start_codon:yes stop_codon:yes gene_type:complete
MNKQVKEKYKKEAKSLDTPSIADSLESLKVQLAEYKKQAEHFKSMALKAQGAIEVLSQLNKD